MHSVPAVSARESPAPAVSPAAPPNLLPLLAATPKRPLHPAIPPAPSHISSSNSKPPSHRRQPRPLTLQFPPSCATSESPCPRWSAGNTSYKSGNTSPANPVRLAPSESPPTPSALRLPTSAPSNPGSPAAQLALPLRPSKSRQSPAASSGSAKARASVPFLTALLCAPDPPTATTPAAASCSRDRSLLAPPRPKILEILPRSQNSNCPGDNRRLARRTA